MSLNLRLPFSVNSLCCDKHELLDADNVKVVMFEDEEEAWIIRRRAYLEGTTYEFDKVISGDHGHWDVYLGSRLATEKEEIIGAQELAYILHCNSQEGMPQLASELFPRGEKYGLIYIDPNGIDIAVDLLHRLSRSKNYKGIDFLIHLAAGTYKRARRNPATYLNEPLDKALRRIRKAHWYISKPQGVHQWAFLFGTTRKDILKLQDQGLHYIGYPKGEKLLHELSYTIEERRKETC